ncbi:MAG: tRNA 2-thiouridine(34) synthase MnmA [Planctomycetota bacterium]|nr:MAG: tRNA 2-thiouridine(34) synthase MnmA [Planctomycetota bacterium]
MARIVVGMSGGVDSSLAACLLAEAGHEVVGVTLKLWPCAEEDGGFTREDACCSPTETIDARSVAQSQGLKHYVFDSEDAFRRGVVDDFLASYARGETPNPCIRCNETIKFGDLWTQADSLGADAVGTGHYARVLKRGDRYVLGVSADRLKDQTYFLFSLTQDQLSRVEFPLGALTKDEVRAMAHERLLATAAKRESQDICFIGEGGTEGFLRQEMPEAFQPGPIIHVSGQQLGEHQGLAAFTIGQRKGLGVAWSEPLFVLRLDVASNTVVLGERPHLDTNSAVLRACTWHLGPLPTEGLRALVRNRYRMRPVAATIFPLADGGARVVYDEPVMAPSPGQACVAYDLAEELCLGGGWFVSGVEGAEGP